MCGAVQNCKVPDLPIGGACTGELVETMVETEQLVQPRYLEHTFAPVHYACLLILVILNYKVK